MPVRSRTGTRCPARRLTSRRTCCRSSTRDGRRRSSREPCYPAGAMSIDLVVHLIRKKMPSPTRWAGAIRAAGFAVDLATDFDVDAHTGFLPCRVDGVESGFEYLARARAGARGFDFSITFTSHSDPGEAHAS